MDQFMSTLPEHFDILEQLEKIRCIKSCFEDFQDGYENDKKELQVNNQEDKSQITHGHQNEEGTIYHQFGEIANMLSATYTGA